MGLNIIEGICLGAKNLADLGCLVKVWFFGWTGFVGLVLLFQGVLFCRKDTFGEVRRRRDIVLASQDGSCIGDFWSRNALPLPSGRVQ